MERTCCTIAVRSLTVGYDGKPLVRDIDFDLERGEILSLIGPNGAGKTTVLKSILRQLEPLGGTVYLEGRDLKAMSGQDMARSLAILLTERLRTEMMTGREVVATGRYPYTGPFGLLTKHDWKVVEESMDLVGVRAFEELDFARLSDGQRQRVMLARAISQEPKILVLDEPTSFLDIRHKLEFLSVLQDMARKKGLTVIMSLHELDLARRISHKIACIRKDRVERLGTPEEIFVPGYITELYGMKEGYYDESTGDLELPGPAGQQEVFVLGGNGTGTAVYRRLQRDDVPFATGILWENDLDYPTAAMLASEVVSVRAFGRITEKEKSRARALMEGCRQVVCTLNPQKGGAVYEELEEMLGWAKGKLVMV